MTYHDSYLGGLSKGFRTALYILEQTKLNAPKYNSNNSEEWAIYRAKKEIIQKVTEQIEEERKQLTYDKFDGSEEN